jgi:hypothetical protein
MNRLAAPLYKRIYLAVTNLRRGLIILYFVCRRVSWYVFLVREHVPREYILRGVYLHLRIFLGRRTRVAKMPVSTLKMFKASDCGRLGC